MLSFFNRLLFCATMWILMPTPVWSQVTFEKSYVSPGEDYAYCIRQTFDGGYMLVGDNGSSPGGSDIYVIRTDSAGDTLWTHTYGGVDLDFANYMIQTSDGGFIIAGSAYSFGGGCLIKIDINGNIVWNKSYQGSEITSLVENANHEIACTGIANQIGGSTFDIWFLKLDSLGNILTSLLYDGNDDEKGRSICHTSDGGFLLYGEQDTLSSFYDRLVIRIDSAGNILWSKKFDDSMLNFFVARNVCPTNDNGSVFFCTASGSGAMDLIKVDSLGNVSWINEYTAGGGFQILIPFTIQNTLEGGFIVTGNCDKQSKRNTFLIKTNSSGIIEWSYIYGDTTIRDSEGHYVICTSENGYAVAGIKFPNSTTDDMSILKVDSLGHNICYSNLNITLSSTNIPNSIYPVNIIAGNYSVTSPIFQVGSGGNYYSQCPVANQIVETNIPVFSFYPNPFHSSAALKIKNENSIIENSVLRIYNTMGELMREEKISNLNSYILHRGSLHDGLYFFQLQKNSGELIGTGKFIIE